MKKNRLTFWLKHFENSFVTRRLLFSQREIFEKNQTKQKKICHRFFVVVVVGVTKPFLPLPKKNVNILFPCVCLCVYVYVVSIKFSFDNKKKIDRIISKFLLFCSCSVVIIIFICHCLLVHYSSGIHCTKIHESLSILSKFHLNI